MYIKTLLTIVAIILFNISFVQNSDRYYKLTEKAKNFYEKEKYLKSGQTYSEAFMISINDTLSFIDRYYATVSWALAEKIDSAFVQLFIFSQKIFSKETIHNAPILELFVACDYILADTNLSALHTDQRWEEFLEVIKDNREITLDKLDMQLVLMLDTIYKIDQAIRHPIDSIGQAYGWESEEIEAYFRKMRKQDSLYLIKVEKILNDQGWLGADVVGYEGNLALFLVIQHSAPEIRTKYLPMMREAAEKGDVRGDHLGYVEDRHAMEHNRKQIYGSQLAVDTVTGETYLWPLVDPENVNKRRAEVGLNTIQEYLIQNYGMKWDLEEHKKRIKEFENNQNE